MLWLRFAILLCSLCIFFCPCSLLADQARVTAIALDLKQIRETEDVQIVRAANAKKEPLMLGAKLEIGDSLRSISGKPIVELRCPNGTVYVCRGKFEVVLIPPTSANCAVDVLNGSLDVLTNSPTEVNGGGVHLASEGTVYSVNVNRLSVAEPFRLAVFDGKVKILGDNSVGQGAAFAIQEKIRNRSQLNEERDVLPVAAALAQVDTACSRSSVDGQKIFQTLRERHALVLIAPENREERLALVRTQVMYRIQSGSAAYQVRRLGLAEEDLVKIRQNGPVSDSDQSPVDVPLGALQRNYRIDQAHSSITFKIRHFVSNIIGRFTAFYGDIKFDERNLMSSGVKFVVLAASIDTANSDRDEDLRSDKFFEVEKYPVLTFVSTRVVPRSENTLDVTGNLTLHGITRQIIFPVKFLGTFNLTNGEKIGFEASFAINRREFGVNWNNVLDSGPMIGDEVMVVIEAEASRFVGK